MKILESNRIESNQIKALDERASELGFFEWDHHQKIKKVHLVCTYFIGDCRATDRLNMRDLNRWLF